MRLAIVTQDFPPETGGIQSYAGRLAEHLHGLCEHLVVVAPAHPAAKAADNAQAFAVERLSVHTSWLVLPLCLRLGPILDRHAITHVLYAQWFPAMAPTRRSVVRATLVHGRELLRHPLGRLGLAFAPDTLASMDLVFPNSRATASLLPLRVAPAKIRVVHPGVDLDRFRPTTDSQRQDLRKRMGLEPDTPVVTTLARLVERKGIDTLILAMREILPTHPTARLLVGGSGPDRQRLEGIVGQAGLGDCTRFCGKIADSDLSSFLSLGVFSLLSRQTPRDVEGFGMVLAEAQACGAPVVAARSGGMPEAVGPHAGAIVPPDSPLEAAHAIRRYLEDPGLASTAGERGREFAKSLSWDSRAREIHQALGSISSGPG